MQRGKGKPFLEIFALALNEDYRFPIFEIFVLLFILAPFAFVTPGAFFSIGVSEGYSFLTGVFEERVTYELASAVLNSSLPVFMILIFKNLAYGFGSDIERGIIQTYLSYPLKRHMILSAKLLSSIFLSLLTLIGTQIPALYLIAPEIISKNINTVLLAYLAGLSPILLISGIILLVTLLLRRGSLALVFGIILYFTFSMASSMLMFMASATKSPIILKMLSIFYPSTVLNIYYNTYYYNTYFGYLAREVWTPTLLEAFGYIGISYLTAIITFAAAYTYFCRRFSL